MDPVAAAALARRPQLPQPPHPVKRRRDNNPSAAMPASSSPLSPSSPSPSPSSPSPSPSSPAPAPAPDHLRSVLATMLSDPQLHPLCDVVLLVQHERFPAHRAVLAAVSSVFRAMFTAPMREATAAEVRLHDLRPSAWRLAQHYIYHAQLHLPDEPTALQLLPVARMYHLHPLELFVERFLVSRVAAHNCFALLHPAQHFALRALHAACFAAMHAHFESLALSPPWLRLPLPLLARIVRSPALVLKSELSVLRAVLRWVDADRPHRAPHLDRLLARVRLSHLSDHQLADASRRNPHLLLHSTAFRNALLHRLTARPAAAAAAAASHHPALLAEAHLKPRRRDANIFTFTHLQRAVTRMPPADDEEIVRTPWALDHRTAILWRLKIYPRGYGKAKHLFLSMYVQARAASVHATLDLNAKFDIFLINRNDPAKTISFSSSHHFTDASDHWGFHRFLQLTNMTDTSLGFLHHDSDSLLLGATLYMPDSPPSHPSDASDTSDCELPLQDATHIPPCSSSIAASELCTDS